MMDFTRQVSDLFEIDFGKPLVSALDSPTVDAYLKGNRNRLKWHRRLGFLLGTLWHALISRKRQVRANL